MSAKENEQAERIGIEKLFYLYFKYSDCTQLKLTSIGSYEKNDFIMTSGNSTTSLNIVGEYKRRRGSIEQYRDVIIEYSKMKFLFDVVNLSGATGWYINEFDDGIMIYNINDYVEREREIKDYLFVKQDLPKNNYGGEERQKYIRYLPYFHSHTILTKPGYTPITYNQLIQKFIDDLKPKSIAKKRFELVYENGKAKIKESRYETAGSKL